ncbi:MAG: hypothetical protein QM736_15030 [Vicinamibacterales bacterium]
MSSVVVALIVDARSEFYRVLTRWPFRSLSADTLLVRPEGDDVVYLTDPSSADRHPGPLRRLPLAQNHLAAAQVVHGASGAFESQDSAGTPVLAAGSAVPGTPWWLIVKQPLDMVYEPFWRQVRAGLGVRAPAHRHDVVRSDHDDASAGTSRAPGTSGRGQGARGRRRAAALRDARVARPLRRPRRAWTDSGVERAGGADIRVDTCGSDWPALHDTVARAAVRRRGTTTRSSSAAPGCRMRALAAT